MSTLEMVLWAAMVLFVIAMLLVVAFMQQPTSSMRQGLADNAYDDEHRKPGDGF